jgi:hypothetical protein
MARAGARTASRRAPAASDRQRIDHGALARFPRFLEYGDNLRAFDRRFTGLARTLSCGMEAVPPAASTSCSR